MPRARAHQRSSLLDHKLMRRLRVTQTVVCNGIDIELAEDVSAAVIAPL